MSATAAFRSAEEKGSPAPTLGGPASGDTKTETSSDAGSSPAGLCGVIQEDGCLPDNSGHLDIDCKPTDAGIAPASYKGCRVAKDESGAFGPTCGAANTLGVDGASCSQASDCASGFDCVDGEKGPVCRRYCCLSSSCDGQLSTNGGSTFCDVRKLASLDQHMVPVCMPIKSCKLLREADCGDKETCAVVTEKGATSCVPRGDAPEGASCDETHCEANLNCLGSPGDRHCYKLCRVGGADCKAMETCTTGSVFQDTTFGVCKKQ